MSYVVDGGGVEMARFRKDILKPGTYRLLNGKLRTYTRADVLGMERRIKDMIADRINIPVTWGHQQDVHAMTPNERLAADIKGICGDVVGAEMDGDRLSVLLDVPNAGDADRLKAVKFVSPEIITDFKDGNNKSWPGRSVTHVAVTGKPVQTDQKPFEPVHLSRDVVWLSLDDLVKGEKKVAKGEEEKAKEDDVPVEVKEELDEDADDMGKGLPALVEALKAHGFNIPEGVDSLAKLIISVASNDNKSVQDTGNGDNPDGGRIEEESAPIMMSLDPARNPLAEKIITGGREALVARAKALVPTGRVSKPVADKLITDLTAERLSLDKQANVVGGAALARLEAYEALEAKTFRRPGAPSRNGDQLSHDGITPEERPEGLASAGEKEDRARARKDAESLSVSTAGGR